MMMNEPFTLTLTPGVVALMFLLGCLFVCRVYVSGQNLGFARAYKDEFAKLWSVCEDHRENIDALTDR